MKQKRQGLIAGALIGATITGGVVFATTGAKTIEVFYDNIKVYKDNVLCELKDANGTVVEPFIYNGTTYMPVRGTANLADMQVTWEGSTKSVYLWDKQVPSGTYLMEVCPPYDNNGTSYFSSQLDKFEMDGEKYSNGVTLGNGSRALYNLNGKYSNIKCVVGHASDIDCEKEILFIVDGKTIKTITLEPECLSKTVSIPVKYGLQLKITVDGGSSWNKNAGIGNITVQ